YVKSSQPALARAAYEEAYELAPQNSMLQRKMQSLGPAPAAASAIDPASNEVQRSKAGRILVNLWHANSMQKFSELYKSGGANYAKAGIRSVTGTGSGGIARSSDRTGSGGSNTERTGNSNSETMGPENTRPRKRSSRVDP